jgi:hypothetical protein
LDTNGRNTCAFRTWYRSIAQEVEKVFPEIVADRENGYKAVKYEKLVSVLIEGIKELKQEVDLLKKKING